MHSMKKQTIRLHSSLGWQIQQFNKKFTKCILVNIKNV
jgi:hypothetical protein